MTNEEIRPYALRMTRKKNLTILTFHDNTTMIGYFNNGVAPNQFESNTWDFVQTPAEEGKITLVAGNSIKSIRFIED